MASEIQNGWEGIGDAPIPSVPVGAQHPLDVTILLFLPVWFSKTLRIHSTILTSLFIP